MVAAGIELAEMVIDRQRQVHYRTASGDGVLQRRQRPTASGLAQQRPELDDRRVLHNRISIVEDEWRVDRPAIDEPCGDGQERQDRQYDGPIDRSLRALRRRCIRVRRNRLRSVPALRRRILLGFLLVTNHQPAPRTPIASTSFPMGHSFDYGCRRFDCKSNARVTQDKSAIASSTAGVHGYFNVITYPSHSAWNFSMSSTPSVVFKVS